MRVLMMSLYFLLNVAIADALPTMVKKPVTLTFYYDYACPHCRRMGRRLQALKARYPGLKINYRPVPLLTKDDWSIALFALMAKEQGKWAIIHRRLMALPHAPGIFDIERLENRYQIRRINDEGLKRLSKRLHDNLNSLMRLSHERRIALPTWVLTSSMNFQPIILRGEQSLPLLSAVVQQLWPSP